ncbi:MAG: methionyl-tRNA formyltransferase [Caldimicrobium sp.]
MEKFRTLFFGTPEFVLPVLNFLWEKEILLGVVTQPDKPKGRGLEPTPSPVKTWALEHNLKILEPAKLKDKTFLLTLKEINPDLIVVFAYGKILPKEVLEIPKEGCWNIHLSLLPKYRGASPVQWALLNGEKETGVTIMLMDEGMDTGPILLQKKLPIEDDDTTPILLKKLSNLSVEALKEALSLHKMGKLKPIPQPQEEVSYAPLIKKDDGLVNFRDPAELIVRKIKAFTPWPGVFTFFKGKILKIHSAEVKDLESQGKTPGEILKIGKEGLYIVTSSKVLLLKEVQMEGKKKISAYDFAQGFHLKVGDTLN